MRKSLLLLTAGFAIASASQAQKLGCAVTEKHRIEPGQTLRINGIDTLKKDRGLADNYYLWDNGASLNVKFMSGKLKMSKCGVKTTGWQFWTLNVYRKDEFPFLITHPPLSQWPSLTELYYLQSP